VDTTVGAYEAKTHLPRLLEEVARGATVTITKHGHPIARLVPVAAARPPAEVVEQIRAARSEVRLGRASLRKLIAEGRR
jgi:prevent-host-death family protein